MKQAKTMMMNAIRRAGRDNEDSECRNHIWAIAHTDNAKQRWSLRKSVEERFPNADVYMHRFP